VDFDAFIAGVEEKLVADPLRMEDIDELFSVVAGMDVRDGTTELADMMHVLTGIHTTHNTKLSPEEVTDIMAELRIPRGEAISVRDFVKAMSSGFVQFTEE